MFIRAGVFLRFKTVLTGSSSGGRHGDFEVLPPAGAR